MSFLLLDSQKGGNVYEHLMCSIGFCLMGHMKTVEVIFFIFCKQQQRSIQQEQHPKLINVNKLWQSTHCLSVWRSLKYGRWHRQGSGMQGQMISLVVNVAYMHHWAKPSQTVFRRSAIWRRPLVYVVVDLCCIRCEVSYSTAVLLDIKLNQISTEIYFCHVESCTLPVNVDKSLMPTSKCSLTPTSPFSLSPAPA